MRYSDVRPWLAAGLAAAVAGCATPPPPAGPLNITVLALNDFHGHLKPPPGGFVHPMRRTPSAAGGAEHLATAVAEARARNPHTIFVAAGDLIGASPLLSALIDDEPTVEVLSTIGLALSAMGNHELDRGSAELLRLQQGGCHPVKGCRGPAPFKGAGFQWLAANTVVQATGQTLLPPYAIKHFDGVPVAFVGLTLKGTPAMVAPAGVAGLHFADEADTVNRLVPELRRQGAEAIVVLMHEGGVLGGNVGSDINECTDLRGPVVDIVRRFDKAVDVVVSGHTHRAYNCRIDGRLVTSADRNGTLLTHIELVIDRQSRDVQSAAAENRVLAHERYARAPAISELIATYDRLIGPIARRPIGSLALPLPAQPNDAGESPLGRVIADAQLEATRDAGAQIALMNPGGVRGNLGRGDKLDISYEDLFTVQPFYNQLVTMTLSGEQILQLLEQQWGSHAQRLLRVSAGFSYRWAAQPAPGAPRVQPGSVTLNGRPLDPRADYRVTVNSFLASGGDGFTVLTQGRDRQVGVVDVDALEAYVKARPRLQADPTPRLIRVD